MVGERSRYPHTIRGWLGYMHEHGVSDRPVPPVGSDLIARYNYEDPEDIKPERAALGAVMAVRAYQHARKTWIAQTDMLSLPSTGTLRHPLELMDKSKAIGKAFVDAMVIGLLRDERYIKTLPSDNPVAQRYNRLDTIMQPVVNDILPQDRKRHIYSNEKIIDPSPVFVEVYGGLHALPNNMEALVDRAAKNYYVQFGTKPDTATILRIMGNSYDSFIKAGASLHKGDTRVIERIEDMFEALGISSTEIRDDAVCFKPFVEAKIARHREAQAGKRSRTTRCSFLTPTSQMRKYLDEVPKFEDPLKDAFDIHMRLLSA